MESGMGHTFTRRGLLKRGVAGTLAFLGAGRLLRAGGTAALLDLPVSVEPLLYKTYPEARQVELPKDFSFRGLSVEEAIQERRSVRRYTAEPISLLELSGLLHYASGLTETRQGFRAAPSAGATYPIELYPVVNSVTGLAPASITMRSETTSWNWLQKVTSDATDRCLLEASLCGRLGGGGGDDRHLCPHRKALR